MQLKELFQEDFYSAIKMQEVTGRYVTNKDLEKVKSYFGDKIDFQEIGRSVKGKSVYMTRVGKGKIKVLAWSQMHGNEATTTKAVFDLLNTFINESGNKVISSILDSCSIFIIPILNPDGAEAYTRINANSVDLNRDLQQLSQPESRILMQQYQAIKPEFCLNLHDQRTIFSAGSRPEPATLSFLTPSKDPERSIDDSRRQSMCLIAGMAEDLQNELQGRIGRYDDAFNINCAGDTFQNLNIPTVLFEAGHFPEDYEREETRKYVFKALLSCLYQIAHLQPDTSGEESYFDIPENQKLFNDVIIRNARIGNENSEISIQFREVLGEKGIEFLPMVEKREKRISNYGHREIDAKGLEVSLPDGSEISENVVVNKIVINNRELEVKYR
ncbi:M14 family zinc carboxypeptidase [Christiangramia aestuarii]|nr:M14 family zinc carboxypeptidase [Christiangramia aestuarii]